jgi:hypothetical protein
LWVTYEQSYKLYYNQRYYVQKGEELKTDACFIMKVLVVADDFPSDTGGFAFVNADAVMFLTNAQL